MTNNADLEEFEVTQGQSADSDLEYGMDMVATSITAPLAEREPRIDLQPMAGHRRPGHADPTISRTERHPTHRTGHRDNASNRRTESQTTTPTRRKENDNHKDIPGSQKHVGSTWRATCGTRLPGTRVNDLTVGMGH